MSGPDSIQCYNVNHNAAFITSLGRSGLQDTVNLKQTFALSRHINNLANKAHQTFLQSDDTTMHRDRDRVRECEVRFAQLGDQILLP